jgi:hypothetical protein
LFVHPEGIKEPLSILAVDRMIGKDSSQSIEPLEPWNPRKACTQVKLVDLLQFVLDGRLEKAGKISPLHVAIIISAWDLVESLAEKSNIKEEPEEWILKRTPLLRQFITANPELVVAAVFGVSAQGGDLQKVKQQLLSKEKASERIKIRFRSTSSNDITAPLKWLMDHSEAK